MATAREKIGRELDRAAILAAFEANAPLLRRFGVKRIALFGSHATDTATAQSDVDLLVEFAEPTYDNFCGLAEALEDLLGRRVDILTPEGLESIRVKSVAEDIRRTLHDG